MLYEVITHAKAGDVYNIGARNEQKNIDIIKTLLAVIAEKTGRDREGLFRLITFVKDRPGHDRRYAIDPAKIEKDLSWKPEIPYDQGLSDTVAWYLENKTRITSYNVCYTKLLRDIVDTLDMGVKRHRRHAEIPRQNAQ